MFYRLLDLPAIHNLTQQILSFGRTGVMEATINRLIQPKPTERLLDIGCGTGRYADLFHCFYVGLDLNFSYLFYASKERNAQGRHRQHYHYTQGRIPRLGFKDEVFDYVMLVGVLHHLNDSTVADLLKEVKRILKEEGKAYILEPIFPVHRFNLLGRAIFAMDRGEHTRHREELDALTRASGFVASGYQIPPLASFPHQLRVYRYGSNGR